MSEATVHNFKREGLTRRQVSVGRPIDEHTRSLLMKESSEAEESVSIFLSVWTWSHGKSSQTSCKVADDFVMSVPLCFGDKECSCDNVPTSVTVNFDQTGTKMDSGSSWLAIE